MQYRALATTTALRCLRGVCLHAALWCPTFMLLNGTLGHLTTSHASSLTAFAKHTVYQLYKEPVLQPMPAHFVQLCIRGPGLRKLLPLAMLLPQALNAAMPCMRGTGFCPASCSLVRPNPVWPTHSCAGAVWLGNHRKPCQAIIAYAPISHAPLGSSTQVTTLNSCTRSHVPAMVMSMCHQRVSGV